MTEPKGIETLTLRRIYDACMKLDAFAKAHPDQRQR